VAWLGVPALGVIFQAGSIAARGVGFVLSRLAGFMRWLANRAASLMRLMLTSFLRALRDPFSALAFLGTLYILAFDETPGGGG